MPAAGGSIVGWRHVLRGLIVLSVLACGAGCTGNAAAAAPVLTPVSGSPFDVGGYASWLAFSPSGRLLASANDTDDTVSMLEVGSGGQLSPVAGSPFGPAGPVTAVGVSFSPNGSLLAVDDGGDYDSDGGVSMFSVGSSGAPSLIAGSPFADSYPEWIAFSPSGRLLASVTEFGSVSMYSVSSTGTLTSLGSPVSTGAGTNPDEVVFSRSGRLLAVADSVDQVSVFLVGAGGSLKAVAGSPFMTNGATLSVAFSPSGKLLATADTTSPGVGGVVSVFGVGSNGSLSQIPGSPFATGNNPASVEFSPDGNLLATADFNSRTVSVFDVGSDGSLTPAAGSPFSLGAGAYPLEAAFSPGGGLLAVSLGSNLPEVAMFNVGYVESAAAPKLYGTAAAGRRVLVSSGSWKTSSRLTYSFAWQLCTAADDTGCTPLTGALGRLSPTLTTSDDGGYITAVVTATNTTGQSAQGYAGELVAQAAAGL